MNQQLVITLDEATTARHLAEAARKTQAEVNADCMPSSASLRIDVCPPFYLLHPACRWRSDIGGLRSEKRTSS